MNNLRDIFRGIRRNHDPLSHDRQSWKPQLCCSFFGFKRSQNQSIVQNNALQWNHPLVGRLELRKKSLRELSELLWWKYLKNKEWKFQTWKHFKLCALEAIVILLRSQSRFSLYNFLLNWIRNYRFRTFQIKNGSLAFVQRTRAFYDYNKFRWFEPAKDGRAQKVQETTIEKFLWKLVQSSRKWLR